MCGAPASSEATCCEHCGARLATVACPACFGMMFVGGKFCSHCGAKADRKELSEATAQRCPRCKLELKAVVVGTSSLQECPKCEGIWVDGDTLQQICNDREQQAAVLGMAVPLATGSTTELEAKIRYLPCPKCHRLMNRVNFAHCSHVVVDVCTAHGTWFDRDELRRIVEFIRGGGLEAARGRQIAELEERRRQLSAAETTRGSDSPVFSSEPDYPDLHMGISAVADLLKAWWK